MQGRGRRLRRFVRLRGQLRLQSVGRLLRQAVVCLCFGRQRVRRGLLLRGELRLQGREGLLQMKRDEGYLLRLSPANDR